MKRKNYNDPQQLSIWNRYEGMSDNEVLSSYTKRNENLDEDTFGAFRMQQILKRLKPKERMLAETVLELYKRRNVNKDKNKVIKSSIDACEIMHPRIGDLTHEEFWIIGMNNAGRAIGIRRISIGGLQQCAADARVIFRELLDMQATRFIACHNHPSGNVQPSQADRELTKVLVQAGVCMNIRLMDHIIVAADDYLSFADEGFI